jgi:O-antigen/teichoic acid export membrane protein
MGVIKKQGITNLVIAYIAIAIGFVSIIFIQPQLLSKEEFGLMRVLYAFSSLIAMFLPLGFGNILIKYFPHFRDPSKGHQGIFLINLLFLLAGFIVVSGLLVVFKDQIIEWYSSESPRFGEYFYCIIPFCLFVAMNAVFSIYCQVLFRSSFPFFVSDILSRVLTLLLVTLYYLKVFDFDTLIYSYVLQYLLQVLILTVYIHIIDKPGYRIDWQFVKSKNIPVMLKYGFLLALTSFASLGLKFIDMVMLPHYVSLEEVAIYAVALVIPTVIEAPMGALEKISNAKIADEWAKMNLDEIGKIYSQSTRYLMLLGGFLMLGITLNSGYLFELLPKDYSTGINVVYIISIGTFFNMATGLNGSIIFSSPAYIYGSYMLFLLLVLVVVNCIILIPLYGIEGAALAVMISNLIYNILKYLFILYRYKMQPFNKSSLQILFLVAFTYLIVWFIPNVNQPVADILIHGSAILLIYGAGTILLRIVPEFHKLLPAFLRKKTMI